MIQFKFSVPFSEFQKKTPEWKVQKHLDMDIPKNIQHGNSKRIPKWNF